MTAMWDRVLADLPGRALFEDRLGQVIATHKRSGEKAVLLFLEYPPTLAVDDRHALAARLSHAVRNTDTVAVFDDATFAIILTQLKDSENAARVADTLLGAANSIDGESSRVHVSAGIAVYPDDAETAPAWIERAADALQGAQSNPIAGYSFYTEDMNALVHRRRMMQRDIIPGWGSGEFSIWAVPVKERTGRCCAVDLSFMWQHPLYGPLSEQEFGSVLGPSGLGPQLFSALCAQALSATLTHPDVYWSLDASTFASYGAVGPLPFDAQSGDMSRLILVFADQLLSEQSEATLAGMNAWISLGGKVALSVEGSSPLPGSIWNTLPLDQVRSTSSENSRLTQALSIAFGWGLVAVRNEEDTDTSDESRPLSWSSSIYEAPLPVISFLRGETA